MAKEKAAVRPEVMSLLSDNKDIGSCAVSRREQGKVVMRPEKIVSVYHHVALHTIDVCIMEDFSNATGRNLSDEKVQRNLSSRMSTTSPTRKEIRIGPQRG
jgi:hypothetical protein